MMTTARIERIDHPMLDAGGVGECRQCGAVCTVEELLGKECPCGNGVFSRIPRLTDEQRTVRVVKVELDDDTALSEIRGRVLQIADNSDTFGGFPPGTIALGNTPVATGNNVEYNFTYRPSFKELIDDVDFNEGVRGSIIDPVAI